MRPEATARAEKERLITAFISSREIGNIACLPPNDIAAPPSGRNTVLTPPPIAQSSSLFVEAGNDLRHQDRPKGKFSDFRFPRQSAQVAANLI